MLSPGEPAGDAAEVSQGTEPASCGASLPFSSSTAAFSTSSISSWLLAAISSLVTATKDESRARASRPPEIRACSRGRGHSLVCSRRAHTHCLCPAPIPHRATSSPRQPPSLPGSSAFPPASPCLTSWMRKVMAGVEEVLGSPLSPRWCSELGAAPVAAPPPLDSWVKGAESRSSASGIAHGKPLPRKCEGCRDRVQPVHAIPSFWSSRVQGTTSNGTSRAVWANSGVPALTHLPGY